MRCDIDAILDSCLEIDQARVAVETMVKGTSNQLHLRRKLLMLPKKELTTKGLREGPRHNRYVTIQLEWMPLVINCARLGKNSRQSQDISQGVDEGGLIWPRAGDQGLCSDTHQMKPRHFQI